MPRDVVPRNDPTNPSNILPTLLQLWHGTAAVESICLGDIGFDVRRAHKHGVRQALLDSLGWGGHVYGRGVYFAEAALYSHWWFARHTTEVNDDDSEEYTLILAQVFTGRSKDYGSSWAPDLCVEPSGYHSVCGTESDQKVLPVVRPRPSLPTISPSFPASLILEISSLTPSQPPILTFNSAFVLTLNCCYQSLCFCISVSICLRVFLPIELNENVLFSLLWLYT